MPFSKKLPKASLGSIEDIRCICPDAPHMITRCVETDLRKKAQNATDDMHPHEKFAIQRFEKSLTRRWGQKGIFRFITVSIGGTDKAGKMSAIFLSANCALTVIADKEEIHEETKTHCSSTLEMFFFYFAN